MERSLTAPLVTGGVLLILWAGIGPAVIMGLAGPPRELPLWREAMANVVIWLALAYVPLYIVALVVAPFLKIRGRVAAAFRMSLAPLIVPLAMLLLLTVYLIIPGQK